MSSIADSIDTPQSMRRHLAVETDTDSISFSESLVSSDMYCGQSTDRLASGQFEGSYSELGGESDSSLTAGGWASRDTLDGKSENKISCSL